MIIHYCEKCGIRIAPAEVESGAARVSEEGKAICAKCAPARRGSARVPVDAAPRDSRLGIKPLRRDSKIKIEPAASVAPSPATAARDAPQAPTRKRKLLLVSGAVAVVTVVVVLAICLSRTKTDTPQETANEERARAPAPVDVAGKESPVLPPVLPPTPPQDLTPASPQPPDDDIQQQPAAYDPRAEVAQSRLEEAKAFFKNAPNDPWTYQERLQKLIADYGQTTAGKEASAILAALNPGPRPNDPSLPPEDAWKTARDLLELADPAKQTVGGKWTKENGVLLSGKDGRPKLALPYTLPDEYDLKLGLTRVEGRNTLCVNLTHLGKPLTFHLASWGNKIAGWEMLQDKRVDNISTNLVLKQANMLDNDKRYTLILQMRKGRWGAYLNGQLLVKRDRDFAKISQFKDLKFQNPLQLGFITHESAYRLDEIKVIEVTGTGKVLTDAEVAEGAKPPPETTPATAEKPPAATPPQPKASAYAVWLTTYLHHWGNQDWLAARNCVDESLKNPNLTAKTADLNLDRECLALVELAQQAISKGAEMLKDGRAFTLEETKGKKHIVGRKTKVLSADDKGIKIQEDIGGGQITLDLWLSSLTPETLFELARIGLPEDGKGKLALVLYRFPYTLKTITPDAQRFFDALEAQAEKAQAPAELLGRLRAWRELMDREKLTEKAFQGIEQLAAGKKGPEAQAAFDDFSKSYADTAFVEESREKLAALQTRIASLLLQPGLIAKYYSGDEKNKRKTFHSSQVVKGLDYSWGDKGPAEGVPTDNFLIEFTGLLRITQAGEYAFSWGADDGLDVWLDGKGYGKNKYGQKIDLQPGDHPFRLVYTEGMGSASMWVKWKLPGEKDEKKLPLANLLYNPADLGGGK